MNDKTRMAMAYTQQQLSASFQAFFASKKAGGVLLIACTACRCRSPIPAGRGYLGFWQRSSAGLSVEHWINDALMAVFFLLIGLELERELYNGELSRFAERAAADFRRGSAAWRRRR